MIKRTLALIFALIVVVGITHTYYADWVLKAAMGDGPEAAQEQVVNSEENIELDGSSEAKDNDSNEAVVSEEVVEVERNEQPDGGNGGPAPSNAAGADSDSDSDKDNNDEGNNEDGSSEEENTLIEQETEELIGILEFKGKDFTVTITDPKKSLPANTELKVEEIRTNTEEYKTYSDQALETVQKDSASAQLGFARFFDITMLVDGEVYEPENPVSVNITFGNDMQKDMKVGDNDDVKVVHFTETDNKDKVETEILKDKDVDVKLAKDKVEEAVFEAESFSVYGVISTVIEKTILAGDGHNYKISVSCPPEAGVPADAELEIKEVSDGASHDDYMAKVSDALGWEEGTAKYSRLFDIKIVDKDGKKVELSAPVDVSIELADKDRSKAAQAATRVLHFADDASKPDVVNDVDVSGDTVSFEAGSFSVYAIVEAPEPVSTEIRHVKDLAELADNTESAFILSLNKDGTTYFTNDINNNTAKCFVTTRDITLSDEWYFEPVQGQQNEYRIYTYVEGAKKYVNNPSGNFIGLVDSGGTVFEVSQAADGLFYVKVKGQDKWMQYSNGGKGIRFYPENSDAANCQIKLTYSSSLEPPFDIYELDGATYGIAYHNDSVIATALTAEVIKVGNKDEVAGKDMVMRPDVLDNDGVLLVAENSDIVEWTFECIDSNRYYITTVVDGQKKYLTVNGGNVTLEDEPDANKSVISATPGTGANSGKYHFTVDGYSLAPDLNGNTVKGFTAATGSGATTWLNLVEESVLKDEDFTTYAAKKVSVSDTQNVYNGQQVVLYTRIWNDTTKKYEFYVVDYNGSLARCYDTGDGIEWIGSSVNTALWEFTEYTNPDGTVNHYYELQNTQYGDYIAPQVTGNRILSDDTIGVNLNGRRYGENYTTIIAWDDDQYAYSGLKTENGKVVACPLSEAEDFYFAIINPVDTEDKLTTVDTIDSTQYGITMKMFNFNNPLTSNRDSEQLAYMGGDGGGVATGLKGLLSTDLKEDGYPVGTGINGGKKTSFADLIAKSDGSTEVNHLFLESIYNESGYFEYDSTQNFAHLNDDGTFTVYDQIGTITNKNNKEMGATRIHGQFMPYNEIHAGEYAYDWKGNLVTNQTDVLAQELPDTNARKGEPLYKIGSEATVDYFFGMEMTASFTQTANGLDAWGHDIIFEFSGDDDFWLYVDGELVLDLGGVHYAQVGSVNFRTGKVTGSGIPANTTLYSLFKSNYQSRGMSEAEINATLDEIFTLNEEGNYVFKDYTNHDMKMLYMERGAGASNLKMRFNLAAVRPGTFLLNKKLSGTDEAENDLIEFPYQIYYYSKKDGGDQPHLLGAEDGESEMVKYQGTTNTVKYAESFTPAGGTEAYDHVFFLKPGQTAEVELPEDTDRYYVVECGVNPDVYDKVKANDQELTGIDTQNKVGKTARQDYATSEASTENRSQVDYDNHVRDGAMRSMTIEKILYDSDGIRRLHYPEDKTWFNYRLYLGDENANPDDLPLASLYSYFIKNKNDEYCRFVAGDQEFQPVEYNGSTITDYSVLSEYMATLSSAEKETIEFITSMNGSISKIPADYKVEVRNLIAGTMFKVEEAEREMPKGYTLRLEDGYTRTDAGHEENTRTVPISGTIEVDNDPELHVSNQKGWGLTVEKIWTDKDFMEVHDNIYFAVYVNKGTSDDPDYEMLDNTVRCLKNKETSIYYFFGNLQSGTPFDNYEVREVTLTGDIEVDGDGVVTGYDSVTPIEDGGTLVIGGQPVGGEYREDGYDYKVTYEPGEQTTQNENVRTDKVTNSRAGIKLLKTDWYGDPLEGAQFTLTDEEGKDVAAGSYTSTEDGLITIAYLSAGTYTLTETRVPRGYVVMNRPATITLDEDGKVTVSGLSEDFYTISTADTSMAATITFKNRNADLLVKKVDAVPNDQGVRDPLEGAHFALYRQVTNTQGQKVKDFTPMAGYEDIVTDRSGILHEITYDLNAGTYYLTETKAAQGYNKLGDDICFTIGRDGTVVINSEDYMKGWITQSIDPETASVSYMMTIPNGKTKNVRVKKVSAGTDEVLEGAEFFLYHAEDYDDTTDAPKEGAVPVTTGVTDTDGLMSLGALTVGEYRLQETAAPDGYYPADSAIKISVTDSKVSYMQGASSSDAIYIA
ncbi:MAG: hypothetical protein E7220_02265, partial [Clostridiales bacterium]|nr:hypothetical protein [Clostridiales bacterium]